MKEEKSNFTNENQKEITNKKFIIENNVDNNTNALNDDCKRLCKQRVQQ